MKIINAMFSGGLGGIEQAFLDYNVSLSDIGHDVTAIIYPKTIIQVPLNITNGKYVQISNMGYWDIFAVRKIRACLLEHKPDVVITHGNRATYLLRKAADGLCPVVGVCHNYRLKRLIDVDALFATTRDLKAAAVYAGQPASSVYIIPNMIDTSCHSATVSHIRQNPPIIGAMGRFVYKKGFHIFLEALKILYDKGVYFKAILGGDGEERKTLRQLAKDYDLNDVLTFPGWIEDKTYFFNSIDIFCLPSLHEPFGIVLLESFLHGVPVVSTKAEGPSEIITDNVNGRLVSFNDAEMIAEALEELLQDKEKARTIAQSAMDTVQKNYALPVVAGIIDEALQAIVSNYKKQATKGKKAVEAV